MHHWSIASLQELFEDCISLGHLLLEHGVDFSIADVRVLNALAFLHLVEWVDFGRVLAVFFDGFTVSYEFTLDHLEVLLEIGSESEVLRVMPRFRRDAWEVEQLWIGSGDLSIRGDSLAYLAGEHACFINHCDWFGLC